MADASSSRASTTVRVRFRPRSSKEGERRCGREDGPSTVAFTGSDGSSSSFGFDKVYGESQLLLRVAGGVRGLCRCGRCPSQQEPLWGPASHSTLLAV